MFVIGKVLNTHGVKGEIKVKQITDFTERFAVGETVYYAESDTYTPLTICQSRTHKQAILLKFEELPTLDDVLFLKNQSLYITEAQQTPLEENAYYFHEIIGCTVTTTTGEVIGKVDTILTPGANDVWVVKSEQNKEYLIPYIEQVVKSVDIETKSIIIEVMEGLLDV